MESEYEAKISEAAQKKSIGLRGASNNVGSQSLAPITLLYGFTSFRKYYAGQETRRRGKTKIIIIDHLNESLDLVNRVNKDYAGAIESIRNMGGDINQAEKNHYADEAYDLMKKTGIKSPQHAMLLILSWRKFLSKNADKLQITSLIKESKMRVASPKDATRRLFGFFNKNSPEGVHNKEKEISAVVALGTLLNGPCPEVSISEAMKSNVYISYAVRMAFFRKVSKLGLDWARSQSQLHTVFVEGAFSDEVKQDNDKSNDQAHWRSFTQEDEKSLSSKPYFIVNRIASYLPITYSEMKHVRRLNYDVERIDIMRYASGSASEGSVALSGL
ncbi:MULTISPECIES: hypothetical protein [unclassified Pseudomonas]|uniref:hypothetical protein n=1 Tax=unclassified Pseudomonas TaxID=196821 RepID=UPI0011AFAA50|nr:MULTISPECIES: hypothetical protein [unclassified Pseudomonas]